MLRVLGEALGKLLYNTAAERIERREYDAATRRWRRHNARQPRVCLCGAAGTVLRTDHDNVGAVPVEFWYCADHADVPLTVPWSGGVPLWKQTREQCSWRTSSIHAGIVIECGCGTHVGEPSRSLALDQFRARIAELEAVIRTLPIFVDGTSIAAVNERLTVIRATASASMGRSMTDTPTGVPDAAPGGA